MSRAYSRWLGPPLGAVAGLYLGLKASARGGGNLDPWTAAIGGACLGTVVGFLIIIADPVKRQREREWWQAEEPDVEEEVREEQLVPRVMSILCLPTFIFPVLGIVFAAIALWLNRRSSGWPKILSGFCLVLSTILHAFFVLAYILTH